ncbi:MAG: nucleotidyltransferase domain-containing protein [Candidatus Magnetomorum sp.]|nr:nucleotidyltransferase domain-containing protein [Candidatus Magnetomorum sp.]
MKSIIQWNNKSSYIVNILNLIRDKIYVIVPNSDIILYGSRVRGEAKKYSDWDFLILVDHAINKRTKDEIKDCLYDIELEYNEILSSIIRTKHEWNSSKYSAMPFKKNIEKEGILL